MRQNSKRPRIGVRCRGVKIYAVPPWFYALLPNRFIGMVIENNASLTAFSEGGLGETALRLPLAGEGGAKRRMRLSKERFPPENSVLFSGQKRAFIQRISALPGAG